MQDLTNPRLMYLKAALFLAIGATAATLLLLDTPTLKHAVLLALAIWSFSRAYYFTFYVIEKYINPTYRFAGLWDFTMYQLKRKNIGGNKNGKITTP